VIYEILPRRGLANGGFNFDAHLRRQSMERDDLFHAHVWWHRHPGAVAAGGGPAPGGRDAGSGTQRPVRRMGRPLGASIMDGSLSLAGLEQKAAVGGIDPRPVSGRQEQLENLVNRALWLAIRSGR